MKKHIIPIFIPHEGCPNNCAFCDQRAISGESKTPSIEECEKIIELHIKSNNRDFIEIAFFGGSFTAIPEKNQEIYLQTAKKYIDKGLVSGIRLSTRPDCITEKNLLLLKRYGVNIIELGAQSMDDNVLKMSKRGHESCDTERAVELLKKHDFLFGIQTMLYLPGADIKSDIYTAKKVVKFLPDCVRIYPTMVLKNTELENMLNSGIYKEYNDTCAIRLVAKLLEIYGRSNINVIRVGLASTYDLSEKSKIASGILHPALKQEAQSLLFLKHTVRQIKLKKLYLYKNLNIYINIIYRTQVSGESKKNIKYLKHLFNFNKINIISDNGKINCYKIPSFDHLFYLEAFNCF